ncbi:MAG: outer membrane lipoprotein-sorting protein [bacterium]|nr:outer membrane lipoprotein-sorting protein [bacterium]
MKNLNTLLMAALLGLALFAGAASAQTAEEIMKQSHLAYYYAGDDGVAEVGMRLIKGDKERNREFTMLRLDNAEGGAQKYYTYFKKPSDVSRLTFMVHKNPEDNDKRWIYIPAVDLVKPISADDKNSSFVGSDFTYEDVSGRHWSEDTHTLKEDATLDSSAVWVIESIPKEKYKGFARKVSYVDKASSLPLKEEYFDKKDKMVRIFTAERTEEVDGIMTVTLRSMENLKKKTKTFVDFSRIKYNQGLTDDLFTERYLKNPPRQFVK